MTVSAVGYRDAAGRPLPAAQPPAFPAPTGGPAMTSPARVDPGARGGGPAVTGTFYPGKRLACAFSCRPAGAEEGAFYGLDGGGGELYGLAPFETIVTPNATWVDYTRVVCEAPRFPLASEYAAPGAPSEADSECRVAVTNSGTQFDGPGPDLGQPLFPNSPALRFVYSRRVPELAGIATAHGLVPDEVEGVAVTARGPFLGQTATTVRGSGFLDSAEFLACKFTLPFVSGDDRLGGVADFSGAQVRELVVPATYVSEAEVTCLSPSVVHLYREWAGGVLPGDADERHVHFTSLPRLDTFHPCVVANVTVTNDGERFSPAPVTFFYCDVYVSPSGDDGSGQGTPNRPFRTLQRAIDASLRQPRLRPDLPPAARHAGQGAARLRTNDYTNTDRVVLGPGLYSGPGNSALVPNGHAVTLLAPFATGDVVVRCGAGKFLAGQAATQQGLLEPGEEVGFIATAGKILEEDCGTRW